MKLVGWLRLVCRLAALGPAFAIGLPLQALLLRLGHPVARTLPMQFHRYLCAVMGIRRHVVGIVPTSGPLLIIANHVSWLDILVLGATMPLSFIAKSEVAGWPGAGLLARLQRTVFVDRSSRARTGDVTQTLAERLAGGEALVLFGEGTTSDGQRVLPFRSALVGAAGLGGAAAVPVQPVALAYTGRDGLPVDRRQMPLLAWYGDMDLAPHLLAVLRGGPIDVTVSFATPLAPASAGARKLLTRAAEQAIKQLVAASFGRGGV